MGHTTFSWANGDVPVAGSVGTKGFNNLEEQYNKMFADLPAWLTANGITVNGIVIADITGYLKANKNIMFRARPSGSQVISGSAKVVLDTETFDPNNVFNPSTSTFTAPTAGIYQINASVMWSSAPAPYQCALQVNQTGSYNGVPLNVYGYVPAGTGQYLTQVISDLIQCAAGDTITISAAQFSGGSQSINVAFGGTYLSMHLLSKM